MRQGRVIKGEVCEIKGDENSLDAALGCVSDNNWHILGDLGKNIIDRKEIMKTKEGYRRVDP